MLRDLALAAKAACSKEDQISLVPLVQKLQYFAEKSKKSGLLSLETELYEIEDPFLKLGIQMIVDKTDPSNIKDILDSDIYYNASNGRELLKKIIIREGLLRIQEGDTPRNVLVCTKVFLGKIDNDSWKDYA
jgi:flagellar motor component MotA